VTVKLTCTAFYPEFLDSYHGEIEYSTCICINGLGLVTVFEEADKRNDHKGH